MFLFERINKYLQNFIHGPTHPDKQLHTVSTLKDVILTIKQSHPEWFPYYDLQKAMRDEQRWIIGDVTGLVGSYKCHPYPEKEKGVMVTFFKEKTQLLMEKV